jgi:hypothetical protein
VLCSCCVAGGHLTEAKRAVRCEDVSCRWALEVLQGTSHSLPQKLHPLFGGTGLIIEQG